ncbi:unnamed protein product, partial [Cylicostephanus goldi]
MADAAYAVLSKNSRNFTGNFTIDEEVLREEGVVDFKKYAVDPDAPLMADFFIPNIENYPNTFGQTPERRKSINMLKKAAVEEDITKTLETMKKMVSKEIVDKMSGVFEFTLTGEKGRKITLDLKNGDGSVSESGCDDADVKFTLADTDFAPMFSGKLTPTNAFMAKKLQIKGDMM